MAPTTERVFAATPAAEFRRGLVASPFQFWTTGEERLRLETANSLVGVRVTAHYRFLNPDGTISAHAVHHTPNSDRTTARTDYPLGSGALLNLTSFAEAGAPRIGQTFVRVQLVRGDGAAAIVLGTLAQGYVTAAQDLSWPGSPIQYSTDGGGVVRLVVGTDPAAGAEVDESVPTGARWQLLSFAAGLATSAAAGNRRPVLQFFDGFERLNALPSHATMGPGASDAFAWSAGYNPESAITASFLTMGLPGDTVLLAGNTIKTVTLNLQAGDDWGAPRLFVREWLEVS